MENQIKTLVSLLSQKASASHTMLPLSLEMELILLSKREEPLTASLNTLSNCIVSQMNAANSKESRRAFIVFLRIFFSKALWLEQLLSVEKIGKRNGLVFLNLGSLKLTSALLKRTRSFSKSFNSNQILLLLIPLSKFRNEENLSQADYSCIPFNSKSAKAILTIYEQSFPCLVALHFPKAPQSPVLPQKTAQRMLMKPRLFSSFKKDNPSQSKSRLFDQSKHHSSSVTKKLSETGRVQFNFAQSDVQKIIEKAKARLTVSSKEPKQSSANLFTSSFQNALSKRKTLNLYTSPSMTENSNPRQISSGKTKKKETFLPENLYDRSSKIFSLVKGLNNVKPRLKSSESNKSAALSKIRLDEGLYSCNKINLYGSTCSNLINLKKA